MAERKRLGEMTEEELQAYTVEVRAYAEDKARKDLGIRVRNGVVSARRLAPFEWRVR